MGEATDNLEQQIRLPPGQMTALSLLLQRAGISARLGQQFGGLRSLYDALGYKKDLQFDDYYARYDRQDIAGRIVDAPASATWRNAPTIQEDDDKDNDTVFETAWKEFAKRHNIWHYLERVDRLAGIGHYAVLLIGVRGGGELNAPLNNTLKGPQDIIYLSPFSEKSAQIDKWVVDPKDPRFGQPETYRIDFAGDLKLSGFPAGQQKVHHTRVLHIADGLLEDNVLGRPRLKRIFNLLDDLAKVVGGSAEMFWQGAHKGLHADLRDGFTLGDGAAKALSEEIDEYMHGLRRYIRTQGMDVKVLQGEIADPRGVFEVAISLIAGSTGIPKRVLLGAERGELASSQDETNWNAHIHERQLHYAEPLVLRPLIDKLIEVGALPKPKEEYKIEWPNLFELDEKEKAQVVDTKASAIQKYAPFGETERVVSIPEFREKFLGLDPEPPVQPEPPEGNDDDEGLDGSDDVDEEFRARVQRQRNRQQQVGDDNER